MLFEYASVAAFFVVAIMFIYGTMLVGYLIRPHRMYRDKLRTYECGESPIGSAWFNFNPRFYIVALVYLVFDIEIAFIYPVARVFKHWVAQGAGWIAAVEMFLFVGILLIGLAYVWAKGDLDWIRSVRAVVNSTLYDANHSGSAYTFSPCSGSDPSQSADLHDLLSPRDPAHPDSALPDSGSTSRALC